MVIDAAGRLPQPAKNVMPQVFALGLHATITELFSGCVLMALSGEPTGIPILLRSEYEAYIDLKNLRQDSSYSCRIEHANLKPLLSLMRSRPLRDEFQKGRKDLFDELNARRIEIEDEGKASLKIWQRCANVGRSDEYDSLHALFCLDTHNNVAALAERHVTEGDDGEAKVSFFAPYDPVRVAARLDFGLQWLLESAFMAHTGFGVPLPEIEALADRFDRERAERRAAAAAAKGAG
jgi:Family of unknown function (DUF5677)